MVKLDKRQNSSWWAIFGVIVYLYKCGRFWQEDGICLVITVIQIYKICIKVKAHSHDPISRIQCFWFRKSDCVNKVKWRSDTRILSVEKLVEIERVLFSFDTLLESWKTPSKTEPWNRIVWTPESNFRNQESDPWIGSCERALTMSQCVQSAIILQFVTNWRFVYGWPTKPGFMLAWLQPNNDVFVMKLYGNQAWRSRVIIFAFYIILSLYVPLLKSDFLSWSEFLVDLPAEKSNPRRYTCWQELMDFKLSPNSLI